MKNSFKNALNALVLLAFIGLAWATKFDIPVEPINMEIKINADSTAFLLKNLESKDFKNGFASVSTKRDSTQLSTSFSVMFSVRDSVDIKSQETITLPFNKFLNSNGTIDTLSKHIRFDHFTYFVNLKNEKNKSIAGTFEFKF